MLITVTDRRERPRSRLTRRRQHVAISTILLLIGNPLAGQVPGTTVELRSEPCATCRIELQEVAHIRSGEGGTTPRLSRYASMAVRSDGTIIVGSPPTGGQVFEFAPSGRFVRVLGSTGNEPGELRAVTSISLGAGDTTFIFDGISRRMNRVGPSGQYIDQTLLPGGISSAVPIGDRRLFASAAIPTRAAAGYPLHVIDTLGLIASFGDEASYRRGIERRDMLRQLASGSGGRVWVAHFTMYRIGLWTVGGDWTGDMVRNVDWFPPVDTAPRQAAQVVRRPATIAGVFDDRAGRLWVFVTLADEAWRPKSLTPAAVSGMFKEDPNLDPFLDTIIEVVDLERNAVIAHMRDDRALVPIPGGFLAYYEEDQAGLPSYRILRPRVVGSTAQGGGK